MGESNGPVEPGHDEVWQPCERVNFHVSAANESPSAGIGRLRRRAGNDRSVMTWTSAPGRASYRDRTIMSQTKKADFLIDTRGVQRALDAFVVAARFSRDGRTLGFALGDGTTRLVSIAQPSADWLAVPVHDGAALSFAQDTNAGGFISGGDDGKLRRIGPFGEVSDIAGFGMKWVEQLATFALEKGKGLIAAFGVGKVVYLFDETGKKLKEWNHPSTVTGLTFDAKGKRVAASHYNGVTLWFVAAKTDSPRRLEWKGSHIALAFHPEGEAVVTAMQENALHGWRLPDGRDKHMRMSTAIRPRPPPGCRSPKAAK